MLRRFLPRRAPLPPRARRAARKVSSSAWGAHLDGQLASIREAGTFKEERVITTPQRASVGVSSRGGEVLNFCANNYLGLSDSKEIVAEAKRAMDDYGFGLASVRFICGTQTIHKALEASIAEFHRQEACILYPSCFDANAGLFEALFTAEDAIISDSLNHASIIDGVRLCKAKRFRYDHMNMDDLEAKLQEAQGQRYRVIATDGVFSMDGDVAPLDRICDLADKYDALVFVDECHATGFFGPTGRGTPEYFGVEDRVDIVNSTLGKALGGSTGGYTAASARVVGMLRQKARPYLFSNSVAPAVVGASLHVFERLKESSALVEKLQRNVQQFRSRMVAAGFEMSGSPDHAIAPVMLGDARLAADFADRMLERGIYVIAFSYPVVPRGQARIRVQLSAAHDEAQIDQAVDAFVEVGRELGVIQ